MRWLGRSCSLLTRWLGAGVASFAVLPLRSFTRVMVEILPSSVSCSGMLCAELLDAVLNRVSRLALCRSQFTCPVHDVEEPSVATDVDGRSFVADFWSVSFV